VLAVVVEKITEVVAVVVEDITEVVAVLVEDITEVVGGWGRALPGGDRLWCRQLQK
jgi:hypothetical protein